MKRNDILLLREQVCDETEIALSASVGTSRATEHGKRQEISVQHTMKLELKTESKLLCTKRQWDAQGKPEVQMLHFTNPGAPTFSSVQDKYQSSVYTFHPDPCWVQHMGKLILESNREKGQEGKQESGCYKHGETGAEMGRMGSPFTQDSLFPSVLFSKSSRSNMLTWASVCVQKGERKVQDHNT